MNKIGRREFLRRSFITIGAASILPTFIPKIVQAYSTPHPMLSPIIKETNLTFCQPLVQRKLTNIIVIHHVGGTNRDVSASEIHQWHLANGWAGIGYHFVIRKDGTIERGRPMGAIGAHCYGYNQTSVGICSAGDFETAYPTDAQLKSIGLMTAYLCQKYSLHPNNHTVFGHRDLNSTLCPGKNLYSQLNTLRNTAASLL
ncbi:N-acetylmuramoyl-L-alanine amidase [Megasphaera paucivorans]|uniref:N-acetylmuramoyl-L-alanine amidase n=1 Tax=Megasphaera paucivorans TaxID=349095 RepID=A0A1H0BLH7_9FIRM|nr:N-acetylmuramoyl-L-alanine amidase [Megasphaera paucivorans]SDN46504.1 N-acetylmuramoyl-L-alanine amidase [Megasphaera paucivorans]